MTASSNAGRVGLWGASGSGKSSYAKNQLRGQKRIIVFDPLAEYSATHINDLDAIRKEMRANWTGFRLAYVPPPGKEPQALSALSRLLIRAQQPFKDGKSKRMLTLVVEEMNLCFPVNSGTARAPGFAEICSRGRHSGIEVIGISQRIAEVDTRFRGNCTETIVFRQQGPRDKQAAAQEIGCAVGNLPSENFTYLRSKSGTIDPLAKLKKPR